MLKLCENGSNIDYLYETSSGLRKATETEISGLTFLLWFGFLKTETEPKFDFHTSLFVTITTTQLLLRYLVQLLAHGNASLTQCGCDVHLRT